MEIKRHEVTGDWGEIGFKFGLGFFVAFAFCFGVGFFVLLLASTIIRGLTH